jgi:7-cyano-7-deazaguanine reductase
LEIPNLSRFASRYKALDKLAGHPSKEILIAFPLVEMAVEAWPADFKVACDFHELSAICPWTDFPDQGSLYLEYTPEDLILELKSLKFYLMAFRECHITQEHLGQMLYADLWDVLAPKRLTITLNYMPRGGIHTVFTLSSETIPIGQ